MAPNPNPNPNPSLFLLPLRSHLPPSQLECMQIDLISEQKTKISFTNPSVTHNIFLEGHACISYASLVLIAGGHSPENEATDNLHIFNTAAKQWMRGPNMMVKRSGFAWGVIGNRLYIAGGFGGSTAGNVKETDVYDFETNELWAVAEMPVSMKVDVFFAHSGKLFARGWIREGGKKGSLQYLSYCPLKNEWHKDAWLRKVLKNIPAMSLNKFAVTRDNELYMVEQSNEILVASFQGNSEPLYLIVSMLDKNTLKWNRIWGLLDSEVPEHCVCPARKNVRFVSARNKVIVLMHHGDPDEGEITPLVPEITEVSFLCPSKWSAAVING